MEAPTVVFLNSGGYSVRNEKQGRPCGRPRSCRVAQTTLFLRGTTTVTGTDVMRFNLIGVSHRAVQSFLFRVRSAGPRGPPFVGA